MILVALRQIRPAIARQVGDDKSEPVGKLRRDAVPHDMRLGKSVQQQDRRPLAADAGENAAGTGVDPFGRKPGKQIGKIGHAKNSSRRLSSLQTLFAVAAVTSGVYSIQQVQSPKT